MHEREGLPVLGLILAGGRSSRMGADKALLPWGREPGLRWVDHQVATVAAALGQPSSRVLVSGSVAGYRCVADRVPGLGPLGGLDAVLASGAGMGDWQGLLVVPVDMPLIEASDLGSLVEAFFKAPGAQAHRFRSHELPVVLPKHPRLRLCLDSCLRDAPRMRSVRELAARLGCHEIESPNPERLVNLNSPHDLPPELGCAT